MPKKGFFKKILGCLSAFCVFALACACDGNRPDNGGAPEYTPLTQTDFLTANGQSLYNEKGEAVHLHGTNLGGWLHMEGWMDGGGGNYNHHAVLTALRNRFTEEQTQSLLKTYQDNYITEKDLDNVRALGSNMVRVPFFWTEILDIDGNIKKDAFEHLDWVTQECKERGMYVLLDLHGTPGGHSNGWLSGGHTGSNELWTNGEYQRLTVKIWQALADHFKGEAAVCGYGLLNEPVPSEDSPITTAELYDMLYDVVRQRDEDHLIVMGAFYNFDALGSPEENGWTNVMYETHHYDTDNKANEQAQINFAAGQMGYIQSYKESWNVPVLAGEFNFFGIKNAWLSWLETLTAMGVSWCNWSYKNTSQTASDNWGLYHLPKVAEVDYEKDDYKTIETKWKNYATKNFTENTFLKEIFLQVAETAGAGMRLSSDNWTVRTYQTDGDKVPANMLDGVLSTRWSSAEAQKQGKSQWIEIAFGETISFDEITLFTPNGDYTRTYKAYAKIDGEWRVFARGDGRVGYTKIQTERVTTDAVRIEQKGTSEGNYWSIYELAVFQKEAKTV